MKALLEHDYNLAFSLLQELSGESLPSLIEADTCLVMGTLYHLKYDLKKATELYTKAVEICRASDLGAMEGATQESLLIEYEAKQKLAQLVSETSDLQAVLISFFSVLYDDRIDGGSAQQHLRGA